MRHPDAIVGNSRAYGVTRPTVTNGDCRGKVRGMPGAGLWLAWWLAGCTTVAPLPAVDLTPPHWTVRQGQAVWAAARGTPGIAGELLAARSRDGAWFVQFAKPPFTLATARAEPQGWSLELHHVRRHLKGRGAAPSEWIWFALARAVGGQSPSPEWHWEDRGEGAWRLTHAATGESLEGFLTP